MRTICTTLAICLGLSNFVLAQSKTESILPKATNSEKIQLSASEVSKPEPKLATSEKIILTSNGKSSEKGQPELKEVSGKNPKED